VVSSQDRMLPAWAQPRSEIQQRVDRAQQLPAASAYSRTRAELPGVLAVRRGVRSGILNDYVTWIVIDAACVGGAHALAIR
jgi:hypothetical protein